MSWSRASVAAALSSVALAVQTTVPVERVTFEEAVRRAIEKNPSAAIAAAGILRAEALLADARSAARLQVTGNVTTTTLNTGVEFDGSVVTPRNQLLASLDARYPLYAPSRWARRAQAADQRAIADLEADETKRQTALAAADAYLTIIARKRVVAATEDARVVAAAHFDLARQLEQGGTGSRLNMLRAQQEVSTDEGLVEAARLAVYRAQEALGVLMAADGPVDAIADPVFVIPSDETPSLQSLWRSDLRLFAAQQNAAERVLKDSAADRWPTLDAVFQPSSTYPSQFFLPQNSWRFMLQMNVPIVDSGQRAALKTERQAAFDISRALFARTATTATSEVRAGREAVASAERVLASAAAAADQARQVVEIVNVSFRAGAATNIEVVDAERLARNADLAVAIAEDNRRRARLELLTALGRFP